MAEKSKTYRVLVDFIHGEIGIGDYEEGDSDSQAYEIEADTEDEAITMAETKAEDEFGQDIELSGTSANLI